MQFEDLIDDEVEQQKVVETEPGQTSPEDLDYFEILKATNALELPEDYEFVSLEQALEDHRNFTKNNVKQEVLSSVPQDLRELVEYVLEGGTSLTEYLEKTKTIDFEDLDIENVEDQKRVMYNYYKLTSKHDDAKIQRLIDRLEESGALKEEAQDTLTDLENIKKENAKKLVEEQKEQQRKEQELYQQRVKELNASLEKTNFSIERKNRIKSFIFTPTSEGTTQFAQTLNDVYKNPEHFIEFANFLSNYHPSKGFDYDKLKKQIQTEGVKGLKEIIAEKLDARTKATGRVTKTIPEDFDWEGYFGK